MKVDIEPEPESQLAVSTRLERQEEKKIMVERREILVAILMENDQMVGAVPGHQQNNKCFHSCNWNSKNEG